MAAGALLSALLGLSVAEAVPFTMPQDTMALAQVKPGMKGYGLTVFAGTEPEKFDVEVISVLENFRPDMSLILIKTPNHPRLDAAKTVAGMSGSPIYLNGKMVGAYAYGWLFGAEPIAGVTPIESMLREQARPIPKSIDPRGGSPLSMGAGPSSPVPFGIRPSSPRVFSGAPTGYDLAAHAKQLAARFGKGAAAAEQLSLAPASTPLLIGGVADGVMAEARGMLSPMGLLPVQAGGGGSEKVPEGAPTKFVDGGAIGVQLVRGDVSAMGLGTVTRVDGDQLVAFGHPMMGGGVSNFPTAIAKVHWILASTNRSFKIGEAVRPLGALVNDRQPAIVIDTRVKSPEFPVHVSIRGVPGAPKTEWRSIVAHDQFMAPMLAAMAVGSALEVTTAERSELTWQAKSVVEVKGYGKITLLDFGSGEGDPLSRDTFGRSNLTRALGALLSNPWETVQIESVEVAVDVVYDQQVALLRGAKILEPQIEPGQSAKVRLELMPFKGETVYRVVEIPIPAALSGQEVELSLAPGYDVQREHPAPESVADLMATLPNLTYPPRSVVASFKMKEEGGAAFRGNVATRLPPGAMDALRSTSHSVAPQTFEAVLRTAVPLDRYMVGDDTVSVEIVPVLK